ncbi:hypothetical protein ABK040_008523 [Willaertia magna]
MFYSFNQVSDVIGGIFRADLYKERSLGFEIRISYVPNLNVPVSVVTIGESNVIIEDFINWINQPPSASLFTIPPECKNKKKKSRPLLCFCKAANI